AHGIDGGLAYHRIFAGSDVACSDVIGKGAGVKTLVVMVALERSYAARANPAAACEMMHVAARALVFCDSAFARGSHSSRADGGRKTKLGKQKNGDDDDEEASETTFLNDHCTIPVPGFHIYLDCKTAAKCS